MERSADVSWEDFAGYLADFAQVLSAEQTADEIVARLGTYCTELLPVHGVGLLVRTETGGLEVASSNTEAGLVVETLEVELDEGPCTDALASGQQVPVPDLAPTRERYPRFTPAALEAGVHAVHAFPLSVRGEPLGALDVIALERVALNPAQMAMTQMLADVTIAYLTSSRALREKSQLAAQLQRALDSRVLIEQAKGVLAERHRITVTEAFERLRGHARRSGTKLGDVVAAVLRGDLDL